MKYLLEFLGLFFNILAQKDELMKIERLKKWFTTADISLYKVLSWRVNTTVRKDLEGLNYFFFKLSMTSLLLSVIMKLLVLERFFLISAMIFCITAIIGISLKWGLNPMKETKDFLIDITKLYIIGILGFFYFKNVFEIDYLENDLLSSNGLLLILFAIGIISISLIILFWTIINSLVVTLFIFLIYLTMIISSLVLKLYFLLKSKSAYLAVITVFYFIVKMIYDII